VITTRIQKPGTTPPAAHCRCPMWKAASSVTKPFCAILTLLAPVCEGHRLRIAMQLLGLRRRLSSSGAPEAIGIEDFRDVTDEARKPLQGLIEMIPSI